MALPPAAPDPGDDQTSDDDTGGDTGGDAGGSDSGDASDTVVVTIAKNADGTYTVYPGDEPDGDEGQSDDDIAAAGAAAGGAAAGGGGMGGAGAGAGVQADSIGAALKAALDILNEDQSSSGAQGSSQEQFASGFNADKNPTPAAAPMRQKY